MIKWSGTLNYQLLESVLGEVPKDHRKKSLLTKYGPVELASQSRFAGEIEGKAITPRLKEAMIYLAQSELYTQAPHLLKLLTGQAQSQATFWRMDKWCGEKLEDTLPEQRLDISPTAQQVVYCMADGCMLFTDDGWQETKVARLFSEELRSDSSARQVRPQIKQSHYVAHLGITSSLKTSWINPSSTISPWAKAWCASVTGPCG